MQCVRGEYPDLPPFIHQGKLLVEADIQHPIHSQVGCRSGLLRCDLACTLIPQNPFLFGLVAGNSNTVQLQDCLALTSENVFLSWRCSACLSHGVILHISICIRVALGVMYNCVITPLRTQISLVSIAKFSSIISACILITSVLHCLLDSWHGFVFGKDAFCPSVTGVGVCTYAIE